jgi:hypothetical protein
MIGALFFSAELSAYFLYRRRKCPCNLPEKGILRRVTFIAPAAGIKAEKVAVVSTRGITTLGFID